MQFIAQKINNNDSLRDRLDNIKVKHKKFIASVSKMSDKRIAHIDLKMAGSKFLIEAGRESFYGDLEDIVKQIIESDDKFKGIHIGLAEWDSDSRRGVNAVFSDLLDYHKINNGMKRE